MIAQVLYECAQKLIKVSLPTEHVHIVQNYIQNGISIIKAVGM